MEDRAQSDVVTNFSAAPIGAGRLDAVKARGKLLIVIDRHEFSRGCLGSWLDTLNGEFEVIGVADVRQSLRPGQLQRAGAVILGSGGRSLDHAWLHEQVAALRVQCPELPIVAIVEPADIAEADLLVTTLRLQGLIPTSSSMEVVGAALRLVSVGGTYTLRVPLSAQALNGCRSSKPQNLLPNGVKLTPREIGVLELLSQGMPNKIIAHRLSMSQSTVKVHVHSIIGKLKVSNRTEAALAAHELKVWRRSH